MSDTSMSMVLNAENPVIRRHYPNYEEGYNEYGEYPTLCGKKFNPSRGTHWWMATRVAKRFTEECKRCRAALGDTDET